jgi:hypothetical protein
VHAVWRFKYVLTLHLCRTIVVVLAPPVGAEGDDVLRRVAAAPRGGGGVVGVAVVGGARVLEQPRVHAGAARRRRRVLAATAEGVEPERQARALARHHRSAGGGDLQLRRARRVDVLGAAGDGALGAGGALAGDGHGHGEVVPVHEADVVGAPLAWVLVQADLHERGRRRADGPVAGEPALAVAGEAGGGAVVVVGGGGEVAAGARPEAAVPGGRRHDALRPARRDDEAAAGEDRVARVGRRRRPHRERAPVRHVEHDALDEHDGPCCNDDHNARHQQSRTAYKSQ